jgi:putative PIN family toxin of toxin-antitoxin system
MIAVVDTNVFVSAILSPDGASREVIRRCLIGRLTPLMGTTLLSEYEDVVGRDTLFEAARINPAERTELLDAFLASCRWVNIYFLWRPNLRDEADNHVLELAVAGGAEMIVTMNGKDFADPQLKFDHLTIRTPRDVLELGE